MARGQGYPIQGIVSILGTGISSGELDANSVGSSELIDDAVINSKILDGAITTSKLASNSVIAAKIASRVITAEKIATGTITANEIGSKVIDTTEIATGAINSNEIASGAVTTTKIAGRAVNASRIATGTITNNEVASGTLDDSRISGQIGLDKGGTGQDFSSLSGNANKVIAVNSGETALEFQSKRSASIEADRLTSDFTTTSASFVDVTGLSITDNNNGGIITLNASLTMTRSTSANTKYRIADDGADAITLNDVLDANSRSSPICWGASQDGSNWTVQVQSNGTHTITVKGSASDISSSFIGLQIE